MRALRRQVPLILLALALVLMFVVWAEADTGGLTTVLQDDFENGATGPLGAPWLFHSDGSTARVLTFVGSGRVLMLEGGTPLGIGLQAGRVFASSSRQLFFQFDIRPDADASFTWALRGNGTPGERMVFLERRPGQATLVATSAPDGNTNCGPLTDGAWSRVALVVDTSQKTFNVQVNGTPTCAGVRTKIRPPFSRIDLVERPQTGWGGTVLFDNIKIVAR